MSSLKERKEDFVSGLVGGSISEIYIVTSVSLVSYLLLALIYKYTGVLKEKTLISYLVDYSLTSFTLLLAITKFSSQPGQLNALIAIPVITYVLIKGKTSSQRLKESEKSKRKLESRHDIKALLPKKSYITAYRSQMMIITILAIIAVDFPIFPRRFAKVETWGTSLMDLGVGSFVFSMGLVNARSTLKHKYLTHTNNHTFARLLSDYLKGFSTATKSSIPLLILGIFRFVSVKGLEYQEHVTEYGVHWNFFFTLGFLPIFLALLDPVLDFFPRSFVGIAIGVCYEVLLVQTDLLKFVLTAPRVDILSSNKEGICSFVGYLSIFILGQSFGSFVLTGFKTPGNLLKGSSEYSIQNYNKTSSSVKKSKWVQLITVSDSQGLILSTVFYHIFSYIMTECYLYTPSRRIANLPYIVWVVSYNSTFLLGFKLVDSISGTVESNVSHTLDAMNKNGLLIFLLANLLTGSINMTINTLDCDYYIAISVLVGYSVILSFIAIFLDNRRIYIKI